MILATSYGLTVGSSYAVSTLLAQIIVPVFKMHDEVGDNNNKYIYRTALHIIPGYYTKYLI